MYLPDPYKRATPTYRKGSYENGIQNGDVYEFKSARGKVSHEILFNGWYSLSAKVLSQTCTAAHVAWTGTLRSDFTTKTA